MLEAALSKPMKLQVNTNGTWKDVIAFDGADAALTYEVMTSAHCLGTHDASGVVTFRVVAVDPLIGMLAHWTRAKGWKEKCHAAH